MMTIYWATLVENLEMEFRDWCERANAEPSPRNMIEFLGVKGYLKVKKAAGETMSELMEKGIDPNMGINPHFIPMREGFIPPAACIPVKVRKM